MAFQFPPDPTTGQRHSPAAGVTYEWDGTGWVAVGSAGSATELLAPPGVILPYAGNTPIAGWVFCDGMSYATASYPDLFAVIGYTYGGSGATFNVPDLRGRVIAGVDNMGGSAAGRLTATIASTLGGAGGAEQVQLTTADIPAHSHGITDTTHSHSVTDPQHSHAAAGPDILALDGGSWPLGDWDHDPTGGSHYTRSTRSPGGGPASTGISIAASSTGLSTTTNTGGGGVHLNVQPTIVLNYIIRT